MKEQTTKTYRYFRSSDFYLVAFLFAKGAVLVGIDKTNPKRAIFAFEKSAEMEQEADDYLNNRASVNPKVFMYAIKELKQKLYSNTPY